MSLNLDARQRAMLQEMGVRVWSPSPAPTAEAAAPAPAPSPAPAPYPVAQAAPAHAPTPPRRPPTPPAEATPPAAAAPGASAALVLQAPQTLYPGADPQHTPSALGAGWLIVVEGLAATDPLAADARRLLDNMLRALRLHQHPRVFLCPLTAPPAGELPATPCADALTQVVAMVQPAIVLVMGRAAARAVLGRSEPLGRLREQSHTVAGVPAVVTYDAPYLLRAPPGAKAAAWADLCRARALATGTAPPAPD